MFKWKTFIVRTKVIFDIIKNVKHIFNKLKLKEHMEICLKKKVECKLGCGVKLSLAEENCHYEEDCARRKVNCDKCSQQYVWNKYKVNLQKVKLSPITIVSFPTNAHSCKYFDLWPVIVVVLSNLIKNIDHLFLKVRKLMYVHAIFRFISRLL